MRHRPPLQLPGVRRGGRRLRARARRPRRAEGRPGRHLGAELRRVGLRPVRDGEARRDPGQHQPGVPHARAVLRAGAGRHLGAGVGAVVQDQRLPRDGRRGARRRAPTCARCCSSATRSGSELLATGRAGDRALLAERETQLSADDPINIQYTSGTTGFPKGATLTHHNLLNNGFFVGEGCGYTEADRVCIPVPYYHCFGMGMGNLAATSHGATMVIPAPGLRPRADPAGGAGREGARRCTASPRCSSPSWRCRTSPTTTSPPCAPGSWPARRARWR